MNKRTKMTVITTCPAKNRFFASSEIPMNNVPEKTEKAVVNLFEDVCYQEVVGFGGAFTESSAYNYSLLSEEDKVRFLKAYFDPDEGIGYNFGRTHINSCDFSLERYTYVKEGDRELSTFDISHDRKYIIPFLKDAQKYCREDLILFASPWSPPAFMKDNGSMVHAGSLLEEYKTSWAHYYAKYIKAYAECGIRISALTVQNEPIANQRWESCYYSDRDEKQFLQNYLIPALDEEGLSDIRIILWDHNKERVFDRSRNILRSRVLKKRVWAVGHHWYSGDHFDGLTLVHEILHKPGICTEFCRSIRQPVQQVAEQYGKEICENFNHFDIASCDWNLLLDQNGGPFHDRTAETESVPGVIHDVVDGGCYAPVLYDKKTGKLVFTPIYYYIGHFSKFVRRGATRIAVTKYTDALHVCAFRNPDGTLVCILQNSCDLDLPVTLRLDGKCTGIQTEAHSVSTLLI